MKANVEQFTQLVGEWSKFQGFIDKIQAQSSQFSPKVIEKLQFEYVEKQSAVTEEMEEFLTVQGEFLTETKSSLATLKHNNAAYDEVEQELVLRHAIGALGEDEFSTQMSALKSSMSEYATQVDGYTETIDSIEDMFETWSALTGKSIVAPDVSIEQVESAPQASTSGESVAPVESASVEEIQEVNDVESDVMDEELGQLPEIAELEDALEPIADLDADLEFNDMDGPSPFANIPGEDLNFELSNDSLGFDEGLDLSAELIDPDDFSGSIDLGGAAMDVDMPSAMLIRDEGVQGSEVVYPFKGTKYRIGRAPDNDIQIKDDSKVSRNHCELSRRGNQFYLVDLGSSNGTLVNGDVFEGEYKLYGGEELKVGETLFRFTIQ